MLATWKRLPFAVTERWVQGPVIWMTGSAGMLRPLPLRSRGRNLGRSARSRTNPRVGDCRPGTIRARLAPAQHAYVVHHGLPRHLHAVYLADPAERDQAGQADE